MKKFHLLLLATIFSFTLYSQETVSDYDGNIYETVQIGNQTWMKENLKAMHYSDGSEIQDVCCYEDDENNADLYGRLYTWNSAMQQQTTAGVQGACPEGWHVPSLDDWYILINHLGGTSNAGGQMKQVGTSLWWSPNTGATNSSGFSGLPGGELEGSLYQFLGKYALFWTSNQSSPSSKAKYFYLAYNNNEIKEMSWYKTLAYSIRCIKDETVGIEKQEKKTEVKIYPNPSSGKIRIHFEKDMQKPERLIIKDLQGKAYYDCDIINESSADIDLSDVHAGIYIVEIISDSGHSFEKLVIK